MAAQQQRQLTQILTQLKTSPATLGYADAAALLTQAKKLLLQLGALTAAPAPAPQLRALARATYEQGALACIRARDPEAFTHYVAQLESFYRVEDDEEDAQQQKQQQKQPNQQANGTRGGGGAAGAATGGRRSGAGAAAAGGGSDAFPSERAKITGLRLLLLLTQGRYGEFHSELEALGARREASGAAGEVESDRYLGYPIRLERWLMEGSYDRVWKSMKKAEVPCEEFGVFSEILTLQIRSEIASSSERAYPSLPLSSAKSLLFLDSEGAVVEFARARGWLVRDGYIVFDAPAAGGAAAPDAVATIAEPKEEESKETGPMVIENALGYARQLETIV